MYALLGSWPCEGAYAPVGEIDDMTELFYLNDFVCDNRNGRVNIGTCL